MASPQAAPVGPVADALRVVQGIIDERRLKAGDRLPTERHLAVAAAVSRTTIRTALDQLEDQGLLVRQVGRGTYLASPHTPGSPDGFQDCSPAEIMASRFALEPQLMPLAVTSATGEDIAEMRRWLRAGEDCVDSVGFEEADEALHHAFALATDNNMLIMFSKLLIDARHQPVWGRLKQRSFTPDRHRAYCSEHTSIVDAVAERDASQAQRAMTDHLTHVRANLLG